MNTRTNLESATGLLLLLALAGCHSSSSPQLRPPPQAPGNITVTGVVSDGPVTGGTIYAFDANTIGTAIEAADGAADRSAALAGAGPAGLLTRTGTDGDGYQLVVGAALEGRPLFIVFDNADALDESFGDVPPNLESVAMLGAAGTTQTINVTMHTTLIAQIVRARLDPDGDGNRIDDAAIAAEIQAAEDEVLALLGRDDDGEDLFNGDDPVAMSDTERLHTASSVLGFGLRSVAALEGLELDEALAALAADVADGAIDGMIAAEFDSSVVDAALAIAEFRAGLDAADYAAMAVGPCSTSAVSLRRACAVDVVDDELEGRGICADIADDADRADCLLELELDLEESAEQCDAVLDARLDVCELLGDAAHEPFFGPAFAAQFVDPRSIGAGIAPNPYLPLVPGTSWVYQGEFFDDEEGELVTETVTVTVLDRIKLIDGIPCLVVNDVVVGDNGTMEDTNDWLAQDVDGNVWYCGEISRDFELFDGDEPQEFELVHTEGSWKHGRDGAKAGILLPAVPEVGRLIRQEVLYGEAEDVIQIESITGTDAAPAASCTGDCLVTLDFTPLEPEARENKYYAPGIGMIVEVDLESGDRLELIQFSQP